MGSVTASLSVEVLPSGLQPGINFDPATGILTFEGTANNDSAQLQTTIDSGVPTLHVVFFSKDSAGNYTVPPQSLVIEVSKVVLVLFYGYAGNDNFFNFSVVPCRAWGGLGNDFLQGGSAIDYLYGEAGVDTLHGYEGDDYLDGGTEMDALYGGPGLDVLIPGDTGFNYLFQDSL